MARPYGAIDIDIFASILSTIVIFAAPAQLAAMGALSNGDLVALVMTITLVNIRFIFMSISISPHFELSPKKYLLPAIHMLSASSFAVTFLRQQKRPETDIFAYFLGVILISFPFSILGTVLGHIFLKSIPQSYYFMFAYIYYYKIDILECIKKQHTLK